MPVAVGMLEILSSPSAIMAMTEVKTGLFVVVSLLVFVFMLSTSFDFHSNPYLLFIFIGVNWKFAILFAVISGVTLFQIRRVEMLNPKEYNMTGQVALVTGGNAGIGAETVRLLSEAGAFCFSPFFLH